jgi:hypothetical protein
VLDQAYNLTKNLTGLKESSRQWDLESYAISCFVVVGRTPSASDPSRQKWLFRVAVGVSGAPVAA